MSFNDHVSVLKDGGFPLVGCGCAEFTCNGGPCFALSAKYCCFSIGIGWKAAAAAAAAGVAANEVTGSKGATAAAALIAAKAVDMTDDSALDINFCDPAYDEERGCCECNLKLLTCYYELQCPPSGDIGCALCGLRCCDSDTTQTAFEKAAYGDGEAPLQQDMEE
ncbi:unnamed protein product [Prorocentrum cordatum]|uniref:Uncharacterized protein n=1 Tax=Prorocentrum cordatum TaxID=2364126 RepID=A0ABN9WP49_9DINO|nr:unnamed protein product [Polarella glacialis]